jgi:hypothetical protein
MIQNCWFDMATTTAKNERTPPAFLCDSFRKIVNFFLFFAAVSCSVVSGSGTAV